MGDERLQEAWSPGLIGRLCISAHQRRKNLKLWNCGAQGKVENPEPVPDELAEQDASLCDAVRHLDGKTAVAALSR
jgi:hypothetical protein